MFVNIGHFIAGGLKTKLNYAPQLQLYYKYNHRFQIQFYELLDDGCRRKSIVITEMSMYPNFSKSL